MKKRILMIISAILLSFVLFACDGEESEHNKVFGEDIIMYADGDSRVKVTKDFELLMESELIPDAILSWSSGDEEVIKIVDNLAIVTRDEEEDKTVSIVLTVEIDGVVRTKTIRVTVLKVEELSPEELLEIAKTAALDELELLKPEGSSAEVIAIVDQAILELHEAETLEAITLLVADATSAVAAQLALEAETQALADAKVAALDELALLKPEGSSAEVIAIVDQTILELDEAETLEAITLLVADATVAVAAQLALEAEAQALADAKVAALDELALLKPEGSSAEVIAIVDAAILELDEAETLEAIALLVADATSAVAAQLAIEAEAQALVNAKVAAVDEITLLVAGLDEEKYTAENWDAILAAKDNAIAAINESEDLEEVNIAKEAGLSAINAIEEKPEGPVKLPAPIHGMNITVANAHIAIGPYDNEAGADGGFLGFGFLFVNETTEEEFRAFKAHGFGAGFAMHYDEANLFGAGVELSAGEYKVYFYAKGNGETTLDSDYSEHVGSFTIEGEEPGPTEPVQLPAPVNGMNIDPVTTHIAIGTYDFVEGANGGFLGFGFLFVNETTEEEYTAFKELALGAGFAMHYNEANLFGAGVELSAGEYKVYFYAKGNGETTLDSDYSEHVGSFTIEGEEPEPTEPEPSEPEVIQLPAPIHGFGHQPRPVAHLALAPYEFDEGAEGGFTGFVLVFKNTTTNESFEWHVNAPYKTGYDVWYTEENLLVDGIVLTPGDYTLYYYAKGNGETTLDSEYSTAKLNFTIIGEEPEPSEPEPSEPQVIQLPAPIHGIGHQPRPVAHIAIGPYGETGGENGGFLGFGFVFKNRDTNEEFVWLVNAVYNAGSAFNYTEANLLAAGIVLTPGNYTLYYYARGNGTTTRDSNYAGGTATFNIPKPVLGAPVITINEEEKTVTWLAVANAEGYEVYINDVLQVDNESPFDLSHLTEPGEYTIKVVSVATGYTSSSSSKKYIVAGEAPKLAEPANLAVDGFNLTWDEVSNALAYEVRIGNVIKKVYTNEFDLMDFDLGEQEVTVYVKALGNIIDFDHSDESSITTNLPKLLARLNKLGVGDFVSSYLLNGVDGGHRKLEAYKHHPIYSQTGWTNIIRLALIIDGEMVYQDYDFTGNMQMIHTPGSTTSFLGRNLPPAGTFELYIILLGDGVDARDSEPLIVTLNWSIN